jgi:hypothetical protein
MKKVNIIILAIMLFTACKKENEISPTLTVQDDLSSGTNLAKAIITRPFEVNFTTTADTSSSIPPTPCTGDLPGFAIAGLFLHGAGTHIGKINPSQSTLQHVSCDLSFTTALLTTVIAGQIASANGDLIFYTGNDEINVFNLLTGGGTTGTITGLWTITGGTGRFTGATGSFSLNGTVDFITSTFIGKGIGTITY